MGIGLQIRVGAGTEVLQTGNTKDVENIERIKNVQADYADYDGISTY